MFILKLILTMVIILILVSKKVNIGISLLLGSLSFILLNKASVLMFLKVVFQTLTDLEALNLALAIGFITILGYLMDRYQLMNRMIQSLENLLGSVKATIVLAPALIGTLLVSGGALMSCPVVNSLGERIEMSNVHRAASNLVFRHSLYFVFPLSTTMIIAAQIGGYDLFEFIKLQFPLAIVFSLMGYFLYVRPYSSKALLNTQIEGIDMHFKSPKLFFQLINFCLYASPIIVSLLSTLILNLPFSIACILGILTTLLVHFTDKHRLDDDETLLISLKKGVKPLMVLSVFGIMVFKNTLGLFPDLYDQMASIVSMGIPIELIIILCTGLLSFTLASIQPSVAILYPLILPMAIDEQTKLRLAMFIYTTGFVFYYISPLHLCQVLTVEYFNVDTKSLYKQYRLILPVVFAVMIGIYLVSA
ncbi:DUF401 family protein [Fusibacter sp. 3D3]|uniref:DUF401 family protein n=1 Tax=Fusibacter sp. 3D3 TaxID=1048380 RepID=UPI0008539C3D|nr:DUF401 family protein [Fusibacter sp. 3D3]GAU77033.1 hypothetical protein F3D3_1632 [Fusibacter sp. 3D3]